MLFICGIKTLEKREEEKQKQKTLKNNENKHFDHIFWSTNQHNKINELKYAWSSQCINK